MKFIGLIIIISLLVTLSAFLWVGLLMGGFFLKKKVGKMNEEKRDNYFRNMTGWGYIIRGSSIYVVSLLLSAGIGYYIFRLFSYDNPLFLSSIIFVLGGIQACFKLYKNKEDLLNKLKTISQN